MEIEDIKRERDEWQHKAEAAEDALTEALAFIAKAEAACLEWRSRAIVAEAERDMWEDITRAAEAERNVCRWRLDQSREKHRKASRMIARLQAELRNARSGLPLIGDLWRRRV